MAIPKKVEKTVCCWPKLFKIMVDTHTVSGKVFLPMVTLSKPTREEIRDGLAEWLRTFKGHASGD